MSTATPLILGISAYYHDSAAALIRGREIVAAAEEERFSRRKHDPRFPRQAIDFCLAEGGCALDDLQAVVFYDKPLLKFERLLESWLATAPSGFNAFSAAAPFWLKEKLFLKRTLARELELLAPEAQLPPLLFTEHHHAHAASAFYPSPFTEAAVLTIDGVGEWATTSAWLGAGLTLSPLWEIRFPHSLGLLYSAFTAYCGFRVNGGEYKLMGLAPYGTPRFTQKILEQVIEVDEEGIFALNMEHFSFVAGSGMVNERFHSLFGGPPRAPESEITQRIKDIAASIQRVTEMVILRLADTVQRESGSKSLCLAGGVALNCVANGRLLREGRFQDIWVQPAAGDAGGALGAALAAAHNCFDQPRPTPSGDAMRGAQLGPCSDDIAAAAELDALGAHYDHHNDATLYATTASALASGKVIGWYQGRAEFGPRALGNRSILADPREPAMGAKINREIKFRESFRPFAPAVLNHHLGELFAIDQPAPYMQFTASATPDSLHLAAVTHVDGSARVQSVSRNDNPRFFHLLIAFAERTDAPALLNTSFNRRGEPIVNTPADAYRCFQDSGIDLLVIGNLVLDRAKQPPIVEESPLPTETAPSDRTLAWFGLGATAVTVILPGLMIPWLNGSGYPLWPWILALLVAAIAAAKPGWLRLPNRGWSIVSHHLRRLNQWLLLALLYFLVISPAALIQRLTGRDPLQHKGGPMRYDRRGEIEQLTKQMRRPF